MKHAARIAIVAGVVGTGVGAAHGEGRPGWYVAMSQGAVQVVDATAQRQLVGPYPGRDLALSADGRALVVITSDTLRVLDAQTFEGLSFRYRDGARFEQVAWSPDGAHIAISSGHGSVLFYGVEGADYHRVPSETCVSGTSRTVPTAATCTPPPRCARPRRHPAAR